MATMGPLGLSSVAGDAMHALQQHAEPEPFDTDDLNHVNPPDLDQNFVFPARAPSASASAALLGGVGAGTGTGHRATPSRAHQQRQSISDRRASKRKSVSTLPAFNFSPAGESVERTATSPDDTTAESESSQAIPIPAKPSHHRRRESEFVGGDGAKGGPGLMSTSPTKGGDSLPVPHASRAGGRGHRHRRSGAISCHDVPLALKASDANVTPRAGSAPTTPAATDPDFAPELDTTQTKSGPAPSRARVGFSETVEFIPRPLSTLSDETSSSLTTVLADHSSSGSASSDASATNAHQPGAIDERILTKGEGMALRAAAVRVSRSHPTSGPESGLSESPEHSDSEQPTKISDWEHPPPTPIPLAYGLLDSTDSEQDLQAEDKCNSKRRQVKSWAGAILPRKSRPRGDEEPRKQEPTADATAPEPVVATNPGPSPASYVETGPLNDERPGRALPELNTSFSSWNPRASTSTQPAETMSPMIDLDAALGPFNTPNPSGDAEPAAPRPWRMYSAKVGRTDATDSNIHRRADSEPALPAFKKDQNLHRLGSSSTMTDVIIEDDEDDSREIDEDEDAIPGVGIQVVDADGSTRGLGMDWSVEDEGRDEGHLTRGEPRGDAGMIDHAQSAPSNEVPAAQRRGEVDIVDGEEPPRADSVARSSDSTITPPLSPSLPPDKPARSPVELSLPGTNHPSLTPETCSTLTTSTISSPDFPPGSFDGPPAIVPASSFTNDPDLDSLMGGEPGPELRTSVDDVPSLTSSNSTMASGIHHYSGPYSQDGGPQERSASVSSAVPRPRSRRPRSSNRASLVSLSRLIGSSHGERSKLSIEERAEPDAPAKLAKDKKGNRLSRLKFWRSAKETIS